MNKSFFVEALGNSPQIKVLDFLITGQLFSYSLIEIQKGADVSYATLKYLLPKMLKKNLVIVEKKVGKAKLYKLNLENKAVKHLVAFDWTLTKQSIPK